MLTLNMDESDFIKNLEGVGMNGVLLIFLFGIYKLLVSRNFISRCGWITVDFRSKELRAQELEYKHIQRMAELEVEKLKHHNELTDKLKYAPNIYDDYSNKDSGTRESASEGS
tara:strand:- start:60 stop:398 length:339 start_codon:yes stop_codon:yes gene_type:complete